MKQPLNFPNLCFLAQLWPKLASKGVAALSEYATPFRSKFLITNLRTSLWSQSQLHSSNIGKINFKVH